MTTIKLRRGLSTAFATNNPTLQAGEPAYETDTGVLKIGDGSTAYNSLDPIGASPDLTNYVTTNTAQTISATKTFSADQNIGSIQVDATSPTVRPTGTMTFRRNASASSSDSTGIVFTAANNNNGEVHLGVHGANSYRGGIVLNQASNAYHYYPSIMFCSAGSNPDSPSAQITYDYGTKTLNMAAPIGGGLMLGAPSFWGSSDYTGLEVARDGSLLRYNGNNVLDSSCVDGTTVTYNSSTGKISANVTVADFTGADGTDAGVHGLVPAPTATDNVKYLRGDGSWATPTDTTYSAFTGTDGSSAGSAGLVPAPATTDAGKFLCADGSWETPSSSAPSNMVTTDTVQTISGDKTFTGTNTISGSTLNMSGQSYLTWTGSGTSQFMLSPYYHKMYFNAYGAASGSNRNVLDFSTPETITFRKEANGANNGVFNVWTGNTEAGSTYKFKVASTGVTINGSNVLTESTGVKSSDIRNIAKVTQAEYDALVSGGTVDANTFYVIVAASS